MKRAIASGMKEVVSFRVFIGSALFLLVIGLSQSKTLLTTFPVTALLPHAFHMDLLSNAINSDMVVSFVPIIAVLPFAGAYVDELKNNFTLFLCIRSSYYNYIVSRIMVSFFTGTLIIAMSVLSAWGFAALLFTPIEEAKDILRDSTALLVQKCLLLILSGGFWSVVGMAMSTFMESKYISYATPFVFYYLLVILYERYFSDLFVIYPKTWTDPAVWPFGCWGAAIFLLEMTLIFASLFVFRAGRRLQQL